jgi:hypothetical protein
MFQFKYLSLRSVGNDDANDYLWSPEKDILRYKEWADFINSIRTTVEILEIEQGLEPEPQYGITIGEDLR